MCAVRVICLRHGEADDRPGHDLDDPGLTELGRDQAATVGSTLMGERVAHVYTSPMRRARETADVIAEQLGVGVTELPDLREVSAGTLDGAARQQAAAALREVFEAWLLDGALAVPVGDGETGSELVGRLETALSDVADAHRGETVLVIGHGGILSFGLATLCPEPSGRFVLGHPLANTARVDLAYDGDVWHCSSWAGEAPR